MHGGDAAQDLGDLAQGRAGVAGAAPGRARPLLGRRAPLGQVLQVLVGPLLGAVSGIVGARVPPHGAQPIEHRPADPVIGEGGERGPLAGVEALGGLDQPLAAVADQVLEIDGPAQAALELAGDRLHQGEVLRDQRVPLRRHGRYD